MRNAFAILLTLCLLTLTACGGSPKTEAEPSDVDIYETDTKDSTEQTVTMTAVEGSAYPGQVSVTVLNPTDTEINSGNEWEFSLQVEKDGQWYDLKAKKDEWANTSEAYIYETNTPRELTFQWANLYGSLDSGHYRVVKSFFEFHEEETERDKRVVAFNLAAEFDIP